MVRTEVAVGIDRLSSMLRTILVATPRRISWFGGSAAASPEASPWAGGSSARPVRSVAAGLECPLHHPQSDNGQRAGGAGNDDIVAREALVDGIERHRVGTEA